MGRGQSTWRVRFLIVAASAVAIVLLLAAAGCSGKQPASTQSTGTAKGDLTVAQSALSTMAPDAKLLLVQTAEPVTSTPVWAYLFGSPSNDKTYVVYVRDGKSMGATQYGTAGLEKTEWASVPGSDAIKVDSNTAYQKATEAGPVKKPTAYDMGLLTYLPKSEAASSTTKPLTWYVYLESGTTTATVEVNAQTGAATVKK